MHRDISSAAPPRRRIGAVVLLRDSNGYVLMVKPTYKSGWILPGGGLHGGESIQVGAARELQEETGLSRTPTHFVALDQVPAAEDGTSAEGFNVVCDGGRLTAKEAAAVSVPASAAHELSDFQWVPLADLSKYALPYQHRRIWAAVHAIENGHRLPLLMHGNPVI
ncbi:NUDIX domain-containing protein [Streptomyces sp. NPDC048282]|uniref:NUDIX domain-containing protein n=1 Tax=unclassified Streptomyces TaxID=2593676 RepID=UPI0037111A91